MAEPFTTNGNQGVRSLIILAGMVALLYVASRVFSLNTQNLTQATGTTPAPKPTAIIPAWHEDVPEDGSGIIS